MPPLQKRKIHEIDPGDAVPGKRTQSYDRDRYRDDILSFSAYSFAVSTPPHLGQSNVAEPSRSSSHWPTVERNVAHFTPPRTNEGLGIRYHDHGHGEPERQNREKLHQSWLHHLFLRITITNTASRNEKSREKLHQPLLYSRSRPVRPQSRLKKFKSRFHPSMERPPGIVRNSRRKFSRRWKKESG